MTELNEKLKEKPLYGGLVFGCMVVASALLWSIIINYPQPVLTTVTDGGLWILITAVTLPSVGVYVLASSKFS